MQARIFKRPKNAMQSGKALTDQWILDFVPAEAKKPDPLMGWAGSGDTRQQVQLRFASCEDAQAYAAKHREKGNGFGFGLVTKKDIARTLSARYYKDGSEILVRMPDGPPRMLTPPSFHSL